jgi:hypothetical protein
MAEYHGTGGRQEAYLKFMRLLLKYRIDGFVEEGHRAFTLLYDRLSSVRSELAGEFREVLVRDMQNVAIRRGVDCTFAHLSPVNSATLHLVQATDLLTGATRSAWEKDPTPGGKQESREALIAQIVEWAGFSLTNTRLARKRYYNLWKWRPSGAGASAPPGTGRTRRLHAAA